jgi:hypothetical protein
MRMHAQTAMIENGFVHLPKEAAWLAEYLHELTVFPNGKHDDQVDSTAQMLDWFKRGGQEPQDWLWQMYKEAQARGPQPTRPEPLSVMAKRLGILRLVRSTAPVVRPDGQGNWCTDACSKHMTVRRDAARCRFSGPVRKVGVSG